MEGKAEARKHVFAAYDCKIQTRKKPVVPIFKATEREEITRFCGSRSRFALRRKPFAALRDLMRRIYDNCACALGSLKVQLVWISKYSISTGLQYMLKCNRCRYVCLYGEERSLVLEEIGAGVGGGASGDRSGPKVIGFFFQRSSRTMTLVVSWFEWRSKTMSFTRTGCRKRRVLG
ncbi:hypothetical protein AVEN_201424-1 [Araneus ventricosus]|uniref:Uncharacterized protein n=1 Tax=Araneus ventricosus TaxID=182803 RepID=A0A4Y2SEG1_ARAVE|nr:hypothetical protein AVEN_201424-1 [Araneus ventricosus]